MKRLLLGPAIIAIPLALFGCSGGVKTPAELPKVPEVVRQIPLEDFEHFPPITTTPTPVPTPAPVKKAKPHGPARSTGHVARPKPPARPVPRPPAREAPVETLPPQQGPICIFPLNMIPNCTPQEIR